MTDKKYESVSQFMDDELDHTEVDGLLRDMKQQPDLKNKINRYQMVGQVVKSDGLVVIKDSFLDEIKLQLEQEPHFLIPKQAVKKPSVPTWQKTSLALAASVALVAVVVTQQQTTVNNSVALPQANIMAKQQQTEAAEKLLADANHERFKAYLRAHSDDLYTHGSLNVQPIARVASFRQE